MNESGEQMTAAKAISHEYDNSPDNVANMCPSTPKWPSAESEVRIFKCEFHRS